ncbi:glycosyltransferase family 4 protein [Rhizobium sp. Leaf341]|uniref:glycosyltransferase family 4 protein n=1 Tax=Rhizobium sp. Leaf341 TaxID=1736344 RepID=UPI0007143753|nr:glycosyltransferase family 4 protein [Rhizobium sp. Leaf341]KQR67825.1 glycosyl transferase [Rhizobium sp. Leaf341]
MNNRLVFAYPGDLSLKTGGYGYDRRLIHGLEQLGWHVEPVSLGEGFPMPTTDVLARAEAQLSALPDGALVMIDGLAFGLMDRWAKREGARLRIVALVHHPLALETGLPAAVAARLCESEREALRFVRHVVVTSAETARTLSEDYGVAPAEITIAVPGTDRPQPANQAARDAGPPHIIPPHIISVGTLTRRKGHDVLLAALAKLRDLPWRASIIGNQTLDPVTAAALADQVVALGLSDRVTLCGERDDVAGELQTGDIFALASRYEGYGMVFAEALAQGLPIVACHAGAIPEVVPPEAGVLVAVDDIDGFADALRTFITDPLVRRQFADAAATAGRLLPRWQDTARTVSDRLEGVT